MTTPSRVSIYVCALFFLPNALAYTHCVNGDCFDDNAGMPVAAIAGVVIGVILLLSIGAAIFAVLRRRRIRNFQRTYVQNAQANAMAVYMAEPNHSSPAYPPLYHSNHHHNQAHNQAMEHHNLAVQQANMQNNQFAATGFGGTSGTTGVTM
ncbi:hypothetical protein C8R47DRAFT_316863 [Mycena vitilis]|nr:hypothetical protein C8R47DRAFT_316863 [Mycena vitilis]